MQGLFSTPTVARLTGASVRQIDYWARTGLLKPSGREAAGKGTRRRYTFLDVVAILTIGKLRERGCPLQKIRAAVNYLQRHDPSRSDAAGLARLTLLTDGQRVYMLTDEHQVMDVVSRQHVWAVALGQLVLQARADVRAMPVEWTEPATVAGRKYHLLVTRDDQYGGFIVQCKELPGALEQGKTAEQAIANGRRAIESVLKFLARRRRQAARTRHVQAG